MSFTVVHMEKYSRGSIRGIQSHNQREKESHTNPDIDYNRSDKNYDLHNSKNINYHRQVTSIIESQRKETGKAIRKDAVVMSSFIITSDKEFFENLGAEKTRQYFKDSYKWFTARYGAEKIITAMVHMDESTPHLHLGLVPITKDGRLSAKSIFTKNELKIIQTEFARDVGSKYGMERGKEGSNAKHLTEVRFKIAAEEAKLKQLQEQSEKLNADTIKQAQELTNMQKDIKEFGEKKQDEIMELNKIQWRITEQNKIIDSQNKEIELGKKNIDILKSDNENLNQEMIKKRKKIKGLAEEYTVKKNKTDEIKGYKIKNGMGINAGNVIIELVTVKQIEELKKIALSNIVHDKKVELAPKSNRGGSDGQIDKKVAPKKVSQEQSKDKTSQGWSSGAKQKELPANKEKETPQKNSLLKSLEENQKKVEEEKNKNQNQQIKNKKSRDER